MKVLCKGMVLLFSCIAFGLVPPGWSADEGGSAAGRLPDLSAARSNLSETDQAKNQGLIESDSQHKSSDQSLASSDNDSLRLTRPVTFMPFSAPPAGISVRWLRNMRSPAFCPFALCHGTCSDIIGKFIIGGSCSPTESADVPGPCSIKKVDFFAPAGGGCCAASPGSGAGAAAGIDAESHSGCCN